MKSNRSNRGVPTKAKKKAVPPPPAMFRLHSPVAAAKIDDDSGANNETKKAADAAKPPSPAVTSTDAPIEKPNANSAPKSNADDALDKKPPAKETDGKDTGDNESDKDSITGEINRPSSPPTTQGGKGHDGEDSPHEPSQKTPKGDQPKNAPAKNSDGDVTKKDAKEDDNAGLFSDSDEDEDESAFKFPRTAIKRPRNSASAEAYAKRMAEKEAKNNSAQSTPVNVDGGAAEAEEKEIGNEKPPAKEAKRTPAKDEKKGAGAKESVSESRGHVKIKRTPRVAKDAPPRKKSPRAKKAAADAAPAEAEGNLKSPPEELATGRKKSSRTRKPTEKAVEVGLKSPPEAVTSNAKANPSTKKKDAKSSPEEDTKRRTSSRSRSARAAKPSKAPAEEVEAEEVTSTLPTRRSRRKTAEVASELVSNLEEGATSARRSKRKRGDPEDDEDAPEVPEEVVSSASARRSKRTRKPTIVAQEAKEQEEEDTEPAPSPKRKKSASKAAAAAKKSPARKAKAAKAPSPKKKSPQKKSPQKSLQISKTWDERIAMLKAHKEIYNTCDLTHAPRDTVDPLLRNFVMETRKQYKKFQRGDHSTLTEERIAEIRALGFDFCPLESGGTKDNHERRFQARWDEQFRELEKYKEEHGDCLVSCVGKVDVKLGNWVRGQRKLYNKVGREGFNPSRLAKLEELDFDFDPVASGSYIAKKRKNNFPRVNENWEKHYKNLMKFKEKKGNIIVGPNSPGFPGLYDWIHCQRKEYKRWEAGDSKALMYDDWIRKLNAVGFDWAPMKSDGFGKMLLERQSKHFNELWTKQYKSLQKFHKKHNHCYVARGSIDDEVLANWIHVQRKHKRNHDKGKKTPLTEERIKLLDDIGLDWTPATSGGMNKVVQAVRDKEWDETFQKLVAFKKKRGHCHPKKTVPHLGAWASRMRSLYKQNAAGKTTTLTDEKIAKLQSIGFEFATSV
eukprot:CAMPEP_0183710168 /NCGR_PEP_ID=MMETSP0737-20130205/5983_1 /TAXON_ID=385413 /ORGANISM="Thalassiosira miniscula, Strain CCMP1093" /LENGTH=955 /DNA_ID=CAMNT_0025938391 /DNA_START=167 /DNA_END=3034 /DNA_ORIENTATION=+